jgi:hypothetical protein
LAGAEGVAASDCGALDFVQPIKSIKAAAQPQDTSNGLRSRKEVGMANFPQIRIQNKNHLSLFLRHFEQEATEITEGHSTEGSKGSKAYELSLLPLLTSVPLR